MRKNMLRNGLRLSALGLGVAQFGNLYRKTTEEEAAGAFDAAWEGGIRYFDTAPHYGLGLSERRIGALLLQKPREQFVLSTKVGRLLEPNPGGENERDDDMFDVPATHRRRWDFSADGVRRSIEESLHRLGLDRIDIAYLHDPDDFGEQAINEAIPALIELREQGVISAVGAGMNQSALPAEFIRRTDIDVIMLAGRFTLLEQGALAELLPLAEQEHVGIVIAGVYNSGLLATARPNARSTYNYAAAPTELIRRATAIADACQRHGVDLPSAALAYVSRHPAVVSVVVGARTRDQVRGNLDRFATVVPDELWRDLESQGLITSGV
ncbi:aldo/keto reductase [Rathayibacter soli]|uniref:aldo/keto reductase n=1 Tax=Rathayibacter soli TaxID=3144168 RepID=UPI0027E49DE8|nr:aldo/keto reductase [Glaciibacter superstes]